MISMNSTRKGRDVIAAEPLRVELSATIRELARLLSENYIPGAPVVNQEGAMIGVVSKTDLLRACSEEGADGSPAYLFEIVEQGSDNRDEADGMVEPFVGNANLVAQGRVKVTPDTPIATIAGLMFERRIHRVMVVDPEMLPVVIITTLDFLGVRSR